MTNADIATIVGRERLRHMDGHLNISQEERMDNIRKSIQRGLPQVRGHQPNDQEVCIVGSGPSLKHTLMELRDLVSEGAKVVALNGAYSYLLDHDIQPDSMVIIDAREFNARFITKVLPTCTYLLASQCHPAVFNKVRTSERVYLWHCLTGDDPAEKKVLDDYYVGSSWQPVSGGCTVGTRAIVLFRILGFQKMHLFGMDSCAMDGEGHAMSQPENDGDPTSSIVCAGREFQCTAWQAEQALEFVDLIAVNGEWFQLSVHGDGLLAHILAVGAAAGDGIREQVDS